MQEVKNMNPLKVARAIWEAANPGVWMSGNLKSNNILEINKSRKKICSVQNVGKVMMSNKKEPPHFGQVFDQIFTARKHAWLCDILRIPLVR